MDVVTFDSFVNEIKLYGLTPNQIERLQEILDEIYVKEEEKFYG